MTTTPQAALLITPEERDALIDAKLQEYGYPANTRNAARSGWHACMVALAKLQAATPASPPLPREPDQGHTMTDQNQLLREAASEALLTLDGIADTNPRDKADFENKDEWITWAKSRAKWAAEKLRAPIAQELYAERILKQMLEQDDAALAQPSEGGEAVGGLDFGKPLQTASGDPVKYICADVIEYKCARVCVDQRSGIVYSSPYVGMRIMNSTASQEQAQQPSGGEGK